ncbi:MAG TPA: FecR family protein [bacterium]|jgi:hypothetical protein|nr:FecR family protein [bacterium]
MKASKKIVVACAAFWLAGAAALLRADSGTADGSVAATAVSVTGDVRLQMGDGWQTVQVGQLLTQGDRVVTGDDSALQMVLADGSSVALGADSELSLASVGSGAPGSVTLLSLARGLLDTMVEKLKLGSRFEIETPYAVAAVKGTDFEVSAAGQGAAVTVNQGTVQMGDSSRAYFWPVRPMERCQMEGRRMTALRPLSMQERVTFQRRWAMAHVLHARRRMLMRRFMRSPMHQRFMQQLRMRHRAFMARRGGRMAGRRWRRGHRTFRRRPLQRRQEQ